MKKLYVTLLLFLFSNFVFGQNPLVKQWDKRFGGTGDEFMIDLIETSDNGFMIGGYSNSDINGDKTQPNWDTLCNPACTWDYWIVKVDSQGNKQWDKRYGGTNNDYLYSIKQTKDEGYILGGISYSDSSGDKTQTNWDTSLVINNACCGDYWVVKIDSLGNKQWDRRYGAANYDHLSSILQTSDKGFVLCGISYSDSSGDKTQNNWDTSLTYRGDCWIVKIDSLGNKEWDKRYGGTNVDALGFITKTSDQGFLIEGTSKSDSSGDKTQNSWHFSFNIPTDDYWIIKIDSLGNKQWDKRYGGTNTEVFYAASPIYGSQILGGTSLSDISGDKTQNSWHDSLNNPTLDYWIVKIDSFGNKQWDKRYGGANQEISFGNIISTLDNGFLLNGTSLSAISGDKTENNWSYSQLWLIKIDSSGNKLWDKTIHTIGNGEGRSIGILTKDHCYAFATYTSAGIGGDKSQDSRGGLDYWIIKFCDTTSTTSINPISNLQFPISISPNPFTSDINITIQKQYIYKASFTIKNVLGQTVFTFSKVPNFGKGSSTLDLDFLSKGIYLVDATIDDKHIVKKIVKE